MIRFSAAPLVGHLDLSRRIFGYLKNYPKRGYVINPHPMDIDVAYEKVHIKYYFGNKYAYFIEDIDENFLNLSLDVFQPKTDCSLSFSGM